MSDNARMNQNFFAEQNLQHVEDFRVMKECIETAQTENFVVKSSNFRSGFLHIFDVDVDSIPVNSRIRIGALFEQVVPLVDQQQLMAQPHYLVGWEEAWKVEVAIVSGARQKPILILQDIAAIIERLDVIHRYVSHRSISEVASLNSIASFYHFYE